ncbi:hypothetical protein [Amphritea pacifica]|uniref:Uncharacterized protein n=1 Tax=Amphritea pacifica TaxID=2811233 RepID=A0ABS2W6E3_9GAMM|nr:hypothetical protein [Amphritea pacifica]MBN0987275.1 hypothetical protein [Amphritea pacifica]
MRKCILHIGMHKTGSSTIQDYLQTHRTQLGEGVVYADLGPANHSGAFQYAFLDNPHGQGMIARKNFSKEKVDKLVESFKSKIISALEADYNTLIFSGEGILNLSESNLFTLKKLISLYVDEIIVVAYVRPVISYMTSAFQQMLKTHSAELSPAIYPKYKQRFLKFESVFFGQVEYRLFDSASLNDGDVLSDFCKRFDLPFLKSEPSNRSLSSLAIKFLYHVQKIRLAERSSLINVELIEASLAGVGSDKFVIPETIADKALLDMSEDILWMSQRVVCPEKISYKDTAMVTNDVSLNIISEDDRAELLRLSYNKRFNNYVIRITGLSIEQVVDKCFSVR